MKKLLAGVIGLGIGIAAATAAMYFINRDDEDDFWDDYDDDDSVLLDGSGDILTPFEGANDIGVTKKAPAPDVDIHQNDLP